MSNTNTDDFMRRRAAFVPSYLDEKDETRAKQMLHEFYKDSTTAQRARALELVTDLDLSGAQAQSRVNQEASHIRTLDHQAERQADAKARADAATRQARRIQDMQRQAAQRAQQQRQR